MKRGWPKGRPRGESSQRRLKARDLKRKGLTYQEIGLVMGISRQRAQQLVSPTRLQRRLALEHVHGRCENCGNQAKKLDWHHEDYEGGPTQILCVPCHKREDAEIRNSNLTFVSVGL